MRFIRRISLPLALLFPALALAQRPPASRPITVITFTGEEVRGATERPDTAVVAARLPERPRSLVHVRADFRAELLRSADDL